MGAECPKQYLPLAGQPLLRHALRALAAVPAIARVFVVLAPDDTRWDAYDWADLAPRLEVLRCGGATRAESVSNGLKAMRDQAVADDWVLVHDAARPA
jgi:2-C-methyl-D-erythritol 4-phosphate cytidylyltransferase